MDIRQLEYLVAIAEESSFTKAAARTHVAQPGISSQIRRLEGELGISLFDRTSRRVALTEAGAAVLPYAQVALRSFAAIRETAEELRGLRRGHVTVGTMVAARTPLLVHLLTWFRRAHPGIDVRLRVDRSDALLEAVAAGELDLALAGLGTEPAPGLAVHVTADEPIVAAVGPSHPLVGRDRIALADLGREDLILMPVGTAVRGALDAAARTTGLAGIHPAIEAATPDAVADFVTAGFGVGVIPAALVAARADVHGLEIVRPSLRARVGFVWADHGGGRPARRAFLAHVRAELDASIERGEPTLGTDR